MPLADKQKLLAFAKKTAQPPLAAKVLQQKRMMAQQPAPPAAPPAAPQAPAASAAPQGEGEEAYIFELVEEAAEAAESGADTELEDAIAGTPEDVSADNPPKWAEDPDRWREAAEAVGLGAGAEDFYEEPVVVAAYLYKKIGGPVRGIATPPLPEGAEPVEDHQQPPKAPPPGSAAKAMQAKAAVARGEPHPDRAAKPAGPPPKPGQPATKPMAKGVPPKKPGMGAAGAAKPAPADGQGGPPDELKQIIDEAANEAKVSPDPQLAAKLQDYDPERDGNPPQWATDPDKWAKAEEAVQPHAHEYENPVAVIAHVYKKMGGGVS